METENTPMVGKMSADYIKDENGDMIKDANGNEIFVGAVIEHNNNLYVIKDSISQKQIVARKEPLKGQKMSWRDIAWIKRVSPYIKMVNTVYFDNDMYQRFKEILPNP